jgi:hypothetical protein
MKKIFKKKIMHLLVILLSLTLIVFMSIGLTACNNSTDTLTQPTSTYVIEQTGQAKCYDIDGVEITPVEGDYCYGQDASYSAGASQSFSDNGDGTITDNVTGLIWQQVPVDDSKTWQEAKDYCTDLELGNYTDWRMPTAKELYNISDFSVGWPYLDTTYFDFPDESAADVSPGISGGPQGAAFTIEDDTETNDSSISKQNGQFWVDNYYIYGDEVESLDLAFGVNHASGHIKAYPASTDGMGKFVRAVCGTVVDNAFVNNGNGTITDSSTSLMWMSTDADTAMEWADALQYAEDCTYGGYSDWRLPNVKELHSIVDYDGTYPAIDADYFTCSTFEENVNYYFWTSTSAYMNGNDPEYTSAWYVAFGKAVGNDGEDSHGAGAIRFSPKYADSNAEQEGGDNMINSVRLVRTAN